MNTRTAGVASHEAAPARSVPVVGFEPNQGQSDPSVRFLSRLGQAPVFLTDEAAVLGSPGSSLRMSVVNANPGARLYAQGQLAGVVNDLSGDDPTLWRKGIPTYGEVAYRGILPGVDLIFHGSKSDSLEYDFAVAPGSDPSRIAVQVEGAKGLSIDERGDLSVHTGAGVVRQGKPLIYQEVDGRRRVVAGGFKLSGHDQVTFTLGAYDHSRPLVIDPTISYAFAVPGTGINTAGTGVGASGGFGFGAITIDSSGHAYVTGSVGSASFPAGTRVGGDGGGTDAFVAKLNPSGTGLDYATIFGGLRPLPNSSSYRGGNNPNDDGVAITVDAAGQAYIAGSAGSRDFPTTSNAYQKNLPCNCRGLTFLSVLDPTGGSLVYSTYLGGPTQVLDNGPTGIALDPAGKVYIVGQDTYGDDFPTTPGSYSPACGRCHVFQSGYLIKLDVSASGPASLVYGTLVPGDYAGTFFWGVAVDSSGFAYVTGQSGQGYPTTPGALDTSNSSSTPYGAVVTKFNQTGTGLVYSTRLGGHTGGAGTGIVVDSAGNSYVTGKLSTGGFPLAGNPARPARGAGFFSKLSPAGNVLNYSTYLDGGDGVGVGLDSAGNAYVAGNFSGGSVNFPAVDPIAGQGAPSGSFLTKYAPSGVRVYSTTMGTGNAAGVAVDAGGNAYLLKAGALVMKVSSAPIVSGIQPAAGPSAGGTPVTITGTALTGASAVTFGGVQLACGPGAPCQPDAQNPDTTLLVTSPPHMPTTDDVTVTTAGGTSVAVAADQFTWRPPTVTGIDPTTGPATGSTPLTVTGTDLDGASVDIGGTVATVTNSSSIGLTVTSPVSDTVGPVPVTVTITPSGATASAPPFTYVPAITGLLPPSGTAEGTTQVAILGKGFAGATKVTFGTTDAGPFGVAPGGGIVATTAPAHAVPESVPVTVNVGDLASVPAAPGDNMFAYDPPKPPDLTPPSGLFGAPANLGNTTPPLQVPPSGTATTPAPSSGSSPPPSPSGSLSATPGGGLAPNAGIASSPSPVSNAGAIPLPGGSPVAPAGSPVAGPPSHVPAAPAGQPPAGAFGVAPGGPSPQPSPGLAAGDGEAPAGSGANRYAMVAGSGPDPGPGLGFAMAGSVATAGLGCLFLAERRRAAARRRPRPAFGGLPSSPRR